MNEILGESMTKRERLMILAAAAMLTMLATMMASVAHAQATGTLRGCVSFPYESGPMPGGLLVGVIGLEGRGVGREGWVKVEPDGAMVIEGMSPGDYYVRVKAFGYTRVGRRVRVLPSQVSDVEFRFDERESRWPYDEIAVSARTPITEPTIRFEPGKMRIRSGQELNRGTRPSLFGVVAQ
jgi:hypothetical protein